MKELQAKIDEQVNSRGGYWSPHEILAQLAEELGELGREINDQFGSKPKRGSKGSRSLGAEIADVLYALVCLANSQGVDIEQALRDKIDEFERRDQDRFK